jgi:hypothetical protein
MRLLPIFTAAVSVLATHPHAVGAEGFDASMETWGYYNHQSASHESYLNPGNNVLRIAPDQFVADVRLNMRLTSKAVDLVLQPRLIGESQQNGSDERNHADLGFRQAFGKMAFGDGATVTAGRNVMAWGPANFRSPSSPFYFDSGKLNPLREVFGMDLLRLEQVAGPYTFSAGHVFSTPQQNDSNASNTSFLKVDHQGEEFLLSANVAVKNNAEPFFGTYGQRSVGDALLLYGEYGYGPRARGLTIDATRPQPLQPDQTGRSAGIALLGASYTLLGGEIVSLEYLHNSHGFSGPEQDMYFNLLKQSAFLAVNAADPALRGRNLALLGMAAANTPGLLGRDYLSLLWQSNPQESERYWRLSTTVNVHDRSGQINAYYEKNLSPRFFVFVNGLRNVGPASSEFRSVIEYVLTVGVKAFIF